MAYTESERKARQAAACRRWYWRNREAQIERRRKYAASHKEELREYGRKRKRDPKKMAERNRKWREEHGREYYEKNRAKRLVQASAYRRRKRERLREERAIAATERRAARVPTYSAKWRAEHPNYFREHYRKFRHERLTDMHNARAKETGAEGTHTTREWLTLLRHNRDRCFYCATPLTFENLSRDHFIPLARGGSNSIGNIVPACLPCNNVKGDLMPTEFIARVRQRIQRASGATTKIHSHEEGY